MKKRNVDKKKSASSSKAAANKKQPGFSKSQELTKEEKFIVTLIFITACGVALYGQYAFDMFDSSKSVIFALSSENLSHKCQSVKCSKDYADHPVFPGCTPNDFCARCVKDNLLSADEVQLLQQIAQAGLSYGGSSGGASILDLHSGALSKGEKFVNIYKYLTEEQLGETFHPQSITAYIRLKNTIHAAIADHFGIDSSKLYFTKPTFFSRMTSNPAKTQHDEYWHKHIDKIQYGSFDYTALIYLADYGKDFAGGQFIFDDLKRNVTIEPKKGRVSFFTSGSENPHHVEKVVSGTRFALTIAFTCDPSQAIKDPNFHL